MQSTVFPARIDDTILPDSYVYIRMLNIYKQIRLSKQRQPNHTQEYHTQAVDHSLHLLEATRVDSTRNAAVGGVAGLPRSLLLRRPNKATPGDAHGKTETQRRNKNRGLRSEAATSRHKHHRSLKRNQARRTHRKLTRQAPGAPAQEPSLTEAKRLTSRTLRVTTLNIRGIENLGKKEKIEHYMFTRNIDILIVQETHKNGNTRENGKWYSWYYSGGPDDEPCYHGVAIVINNELRNYIKDIMTINAA